jgi:hypothetical protein
VSKAEDGLLGTLRNLPDFDVLTQTAVERSLDDGQQRPENPISFCRYRKRGKSDVADKELRLVSACSPPSGAAAEAEDMLAGDVEAKLAEIQQKLQCREPVCGL